MHVTNCSSVKNNDVLKNNFENTKIKIPFNFSDFNYLSTLSKYFGAEFGIFSDFDETYRPNAESDRINSGIMELEQYLISLNKEVNFILGWISGSNLQSILTKCNGYVTLLPHFISSSLGTELYWCSDNMIVEDIEWKNKLIDSGFCNSKVQEIFSKLSAYKINLIMQDEDSQGEFKISYYYKSNCNQDNGTVESGNYQF